MRDYKIETRGYSVNITFHDDGYSWACGWLSESLYQQVYCAFVCYSLNPPFDNYGTRTCDQCSASERSPRTWAPKVDCFSDAQSPTLPADVIMCFVKNLYPAGLRQYESVRDCGSRFGYHAVFLSLYF